MQNRRRRRRDDRKEERRDDDEDDEEVGIESLRTGVPSPSKPKLQSALLSLGFHRVGTSAHVGKLSAAQAAESAPRPAA